MNRISKRLNKNKNIKLMNGLIDINNYINEKLNRINIIASNNNKEKDLLKIGKKLIQYKIEILSQKIDQFDLIDIENKAQPIANYQFSGSTEDKLPVNLFKDAQEIAIKYLQNSLYNGIAYRGIYISLDKIDINNINETTRSAIRIGEVDGFSEDKSFVDDIKNQNVNGKYKKGENTPVKIKMNIKNGIYFNKFWQSLKEEYIKLYSEEGEQNFNNTFNYVDETFENENEIAIILTNDYEIYNLGEIKQELLNNKGE